MRWPETVVLASGNQHKLEELRSLLVQVGLTKVKLLSLNETACTTLPEETGSTFLENARLKAEAVFNQLKCAVLADDSGLEVLGLEGRPGIHSARFAGVGATDAENRQKLLVETKKLNKEQRQARFCCALVLLIPMDTGSKCFQAEGFLKGEILEGERGDNGFGYDSVFMPVHGARSLAEFSTLEKNKRSHRWDALMKLKSQVGAFPG